MKKNRQICFLVIFVVLAMLCTSYPVSSFEEEDLENEEPEVIILRPNGDIITEWVPGSGKGFTEVDDEIADGTRSYLGTSIDGSKDVYNISSPKLGNIIKLTVFGRFLTDYPESKFKLLLYNKETKEFSFSEPINLRGRGRWETVIYELEQNPFTQSEWKNDDLEKIGIGICADYCQYNIGIFCTQVYLEVLFTPMETIDNLIEFLEEFDLQKGIFNSLNVKLQKAVFLLEKDRLNASTNILKAFLHQVEALSGKKINSDFAEELISNTKQVIENL